MTWEVASLAGNAIRNSISMTVTFITGDRIFAITVWTLNPENLECLVRNRAGLAALRAVGAKGSQVSATPAITALSHATALADAAWDRRQDTMTRACRADRLSKPATIARRAFSRLGAGDAFPHHVERKSPHALVTKYVHGSKL